MNNYELTERGKIVIAVIFVVVLLVIPAIVILAMSSCSDTSVPVREGAQTEQEQTDTPVIANTPESSTAEPLDPASEPTGDNQNEAQETPAPTPEAEPSPEPTPEAGGDISDIPDIIEQGPVGLNLAQGTMAFVFAIDAGVGLGDETIEMVGEFLSSPKNTSNTLVQIDMPHLNAEDEAIFVAAVSDAFATYNITEDGLLFIVGDDEVSERAIEISLSFTPISNRK